MNSTVERFVTFSSASARFSVSPPEGGVLEVDNFLYPAAKRRAVKKFEENLKGVAPELIAFYTRSNGLRLFVDRRNDGDCFYFLPLDQMKKEKKELYEWMEIGTDDDDYEYGEEDLKDEPLTLYGIPPWWDSVVVFAGIAYSPERFFVCTDGEHHGKIFIFEHDGGYCELVSNSADEFMNLIMDKTAEFHSRYGHTGDEFISYEEV